jgi:hypothetical protein
MTVPIPKRYDGFQLPGGSGGGAIFLEAYFDLMCPDCRQAWPVMQQLHTGLLCKDPTAMYAGQQ